MPVISLNPLLLINPVFQYQVTVTAGQTTTPKFTFGAGAPAAVVDWGDGTTNSAVTSGVELTHTYTVGGTYNVTLAMANQPTYLTQIDLSSDKVNSILTPIQYFTALTYFKASSNALWTQDISSWRLLPNILYFNIGVSPVTGDISGWTLPTTMTDINISTTSLSGNISGWILPTSMLTFTVAVSSVSGNVSGWILPVNMTLFNIYATSVTGNVTNWIIPIPMTDFSIRSTALSGSISSWVVGAAMLYFGARNTSITGCPILSSMVSIQSITIQDSGLDQATVDLFLSRCVARMASCTYHWPTLNLGGTDAAPNAQGLLDKATLVAGHWTVTTN